MKTHHKKCKSKRQKLSSKYNIKKKIREHRRRMKKEAKRMGLQKRIPKDPGIPNSWPFKAEMLEQLEVQKEKKDDEMAKRRAKAKSKSINDKKQKEVDRRQADNTRAEMKRQKRELESERWHLQTMRNTLPKADVLLLVLDARDPLHCRCAELEAWAQEKEKRIVYVLAKADLVTPDAAAKWLLVLGRIAPTVVVQAEAGREGIRELLSLLGHSPVTAPGASVTPAAAVGVVGYAGTGKKALCKAIRQELKTPSAWLLEPCRLRPASDSTTVNSALHAVICTNVPRGASNAAASQKVSLAKGSMAGALGDVDPIGVVKEFLTRVPQQSVLRHYRLAAFQGADGFLKTFSEDRKLTNKKGKAPQPAAVAQRILSDLPALPGCFCIPAEASSQSTQNFWELHKDARQKLQALMEEQTKSLSARGVSGPAASALTIASSPGPGLSVDIAGELAQEKEDYIEGEDDVSDSDLESDDDMEEGESDLEGEEEEEFEGEESEEEMSE